MNQTNCLHPVITLCLAGLGVYAGAALSQGSERDYPSRPITIVMPSTGPTSTDTEVRLYQQSILESTGKTFVVDYKGGGSGTIANVYVAKAAPNGYTLLGVNQAFTLTPAIFPSLPYDNLRDFSPITQLSAKVFMIIVHPATPFRTLQEYIAYTKANPAKVNFGTGGLGTASHLPGELLHFMTGTKVTFVHYKAASQRLVDLLAGRVQASAGSPTVAMGYVKAGKVRALAITSESRIGTAPDIPTVAEAGVPGYTYSTWFGLAAPARTPEPAIAKLNEMFTNASKDPKVIQKITGDETLMVNSKPPQFKQWIAAETDRWGKLVKATGLNTRQ